MRAQRIIQSLLKYELPDSMKILLTILSLVASAMPLRTKATYPKTETAAVAPAVVKTSSISPDRARVLSVASGEIGVREKTGNNDGPRVEAYLKSAGASVGDPYCAAFVWWVTREALGSASPYPRSAWSPDMVAGGTNNISQARPADTFGIYFADKKRIAHTGFVERREGSFLITIEANTTNSAAIGSAADREAGKGGGVYRKRRPISTIRTVKSWLP